MNTSNMCAKHRGLLVLTTLACVHALLIGTTRSTHAQFPPENPNKIVAPVLVPYQQPRNTKEENSTKEISYLVIGRDAVIGMVSPNQTPGESPSMLALVVSGNNAPITNKQPVLALVDGQRIPGTLENRQGVATWVSAWCAPRAIVTDEIQSIVFDQSAAPQAGDTDVIQLKNGDRVTGFVATITAAQITIDTGTVAGTRLTIEMDTVAAISLVGPSKAPTGARVWLSDGTVIDGPLVTWLGKDYMRLPGVAGAKTPVVTVPRDRVLAVRSGPDCAIPLASLVPTATIPKGAEGMRFSTTPPVVSTGTWPLDAPLLEVEGPVLLSYPALKQRSRLVTVMHRPLSARSMGIVDVVIRSEGVEIVRERLDSQKARVEIRVDLPSAPFDIELQPADGSVVGDMVVFERALLFPN